ncbi:Golgi-associated kinase 1A isoform X3 [Notolabrus celidotus]|uniref:Golgi-associated kinase 1A isoform X3 n=1 Tax=Notolabrus celidotus TaxID=1203425 RepID=UPI00148F9B2E|nr:Golgi-associated kinase 1A isoform X3 [Notolabrus celidotus]
MKDLRWLQRSVHDLMMAWRVWSKVCCRQRWLLLLSPLLLLFLLSPLPLPLPDTYIDRRPSRALSFSGGFRYGHGMQKELPPVFGIRRPLTHIHSGAWKLSTPDEMSKPSVAPKRFRDAAGNDKNSIKERSHADSQGNTHRSYDIASKRKARAGASQYPTSHHHPCILEFCNNTGPKHGIKPSNHRSVVRHTAQTYIHPKQSRAARISALDTIISDRQDADRQADRWEERHTNTKADTQIHGSRTSAELSEHHRALKKHRQLSGKSDKVNKEQQAVKKPPGDLKKHRNLSEDPSEAKRNPGPLDRRKASSRDEGSWCQSFKEQDSLDGDQRRIRISPDLWPLPWLSEDDIQKMELLAEGEVVSKARVPAHGQVLQVAMDPPAHQQQPSQMKDPPQPGPVHRYPESHGERCQQGLCSLIKRTDDWFEVFAFHLDRVLGLNRSLTAVLRTFHSEILPYRYIRGIPRPVVWWDPDIEHLSDGDNDQNSIPLSWVQYQKLLQAHCGRDTDLKSPPCVGVQHSEWGRLALFDFLLQVNDRLDRYCCGFTPDPSELCVENLLHNKCTYTKDLLLVHILVRKADPSRLVFIDNAGRPEQSSDNLNFRLVEGIDEFPERAVDVLRSGCLESLLLRSLYTDREFWDSQGGASGLRPLIQTVQHRGKILLQHIRDKKLQP